MNNNNLQKNIMDEINHFSDSLIKWVKILNELKKWNKSSSAESKEIEGLFNKEIKKMKEKLGGFKTSAKGYQEKTLDNFQRRLDEIEKIQLLQSNFDKNDNYEEIINVEIKKLLDDKKDPTTSEFKDELTKNVKDLIKKENFNLELVVFRYKIINTLILNLKISDKSFLKESTSKKILEFIKNNKEPLKNEEKKYINKSIDFKKEITEDEIKEREKFINSLKSELQKISKNNKELQNRISAILTLINKDETTLVKSDIWEFNFNIKILKDNEIFDNIKKKNTNDLTDEEAEEIAKFGRGGGYLKIKLNL